MQSTWKALSLAAVFWGATAATSMADDRFLEHIEWITANSPLEYNGEPLPTVKYVSQGILQVMGYGDQAVARAEYEGKTLPTVLASYNDFVIYLKDDGAFTDMPWVIVHELVHYLQDVNGTTDDCVPANEPQAYLLHDLWQKENGYEHMRNSGNVFYGLTMAMACYDRDPYGSR